MIDTRLLNNTAYQRSYAAGQAVAAPDPNIREFYIVVSGRVDRHMRGKDGTAGPAGALGPGNSFGERAFFTGSGKWAFTAGTDTVVYVVTEKLFPVLAQSHPTVAYELLKTAYAAEQDNDPVAEEVRECTPENYNAENAAKARDAFREKFKGKAASTAEKPAAEASAKNKESAAAYPAAFFPEGYKGYAGVTKPEYAKYLYPATYKCPNCGKNFGGPKVFMSKLLPTGAPRYDLRKLYKGFALEWYEVICCPHCYFSMFDDCFTAPKALSKKLITEPLEQAKQALTLDLDGERTLDLVFSTYFIAEKCVAGYVGPKHLLRKIWAGLSWLFEDVGDSDMMKVYAKKTAQVSESIYMESKLTPVQEQIMLLTTAGMLFRAEEQPDKVLKWLFSVKTNKNGKKIYADLAEDLMEEVREQKQRRQNAK